MGFFKQYIFQFLSIFVIISRPKDLLLGTLMRSVLPWSWVEKDPVSDVGNIDLFWFIQRGHRMLAELAKTK